MKIYIASKTRHAARWIQLRAAGVQIISTWIDEAGPGESVSLMSLANRCICEAAEADALILYAEEGDQLVGAYVEMGAALAAGNPVYAFGPCLKASSAFNHHPNFIHKPIETLDAFLMATIDRHRAAQH